MSISLSGFIAAARADDQRRRFISFKHMLDETLTMSMLTTDDNLDRVRIARMHARISDELTRSEWQA